MTIIKIGILIAILLSSGCLTLEQSADDWFGKDKLYHFAASSVISAAVTKNEIDNDCSKSRAVNNGIFVTMSLGAGKELRDKHVKKTFWSWKDMIWNLVGAYLGSEIADN